jgi:hypothetical protein
MFGHAIMTILAYTANFFFCGEALVNTTGNLAQTILNFLVFNTCEELPAFASVILFVIFPLPWFFVLAGLLIPVIAGASANPIVGTIIGVALIIAIAGLVVSFIV